MGETLYEILGVARGSTQEEIKQAFFKLARLYHPDSNPSVNSTERFMKIQKAYDTLGNPKKRKQYDQLEPVPLSATFPGEIQIHQSSQFINPDNPAQLAYALVEMKSVGIENAETINAPNICFVIDRSTSMKGQRINLVQTGIKKFLQEISKETSVSLVAFSDQAEIILAPTNIKDIGSIIQKIDKIETSGGTELYQGLEAGINFLWHSRGEAWGRHLLIFTDGRTYGDEEKSLELAKKAASRGIKISALGIGHEWNDIFLEALTNATGGQSHFINGSEDLATFFQVFHSEIANEISHGMTLDFVHDRKVIIESVHMVHPCIANLPVESPIVLGNLYQNKQNSYLISFRVTEPVSIGDQVVLLDGLLKLKLKKGMETIAVNERLRVSVLARRTEEKEDPPVEILKALSLITMYQMQERARNHVQYGEYSAAVKQLGQIATRFFAQGHDEMAQVILQEAEKIKKSNSYSKDGDKRIKYGTRSLLQLTEENPRIE